MCFNTGTKLYKKRIKTGYKTLGDFNELSLAEARELAINYEKQIVLSKQMKINNLFDQLLDLRYPNTKENQNKRRKYKNRVSKWILDKIGNKLISEVGKDELLNALNGANLEISQRALAIYRDMLKIAKNKGAINDISFIYEILEDATLLFPKPKTGHRKIITSKKRLLEIIKTVMNSSIDETIKNIFLFNLIMAQRPHQIRELTWDRVDENFVYFGESDAHGFRGTLATFAIRETETINGIKRGKFEKRIIDEVLLHTRGSEVDKAYFRDFNSDEHKRLLEWWCEFLGF